MGVTPTHLTCCGVYTYNDPADHICLPYSPDHPCSVCGADTIFVTVGAPGVGRGYSCRNNHYEGTCRILTPDEVR